MYWRDESRFSPNRVYLLPKYVVLGVRRTGETFREPYRRSRSCYGRRVYVCCRARSTTTARCSVYIAAQLPLKLRGATRTTLPKYRLQHNYFLLVVAKTISQWTFQLFGPISSVIFWIIILSSETSEEFSWNWFFAKKYLSSKKRSAYS